MSCGRKMCGVCVSFLLVGDSGFMDVITPFISACSGYLC